MALISGLAGGIVDNGAASLNNGINDLLKKAGVSESNAILESWSRNTMLGDPKTRILGGVKDELKAIGNELIGGAVGAVNQAVLEGGEALQNAIFGKPQDTLRAVNFHNEYYETREVYKSHQKDSLTNLGLFYTNFSAQNRSDKRFSLLQNYLFNVNISIPDLAHISTDTRFTQLFKDYTNINASDNRAISLLVNSMELPNIAGEKTETFTTEFGHVSLPSNKLLPDSNVISLKILNTEDSLMEGLFVEWLGETCSDRYIYPTVPFLKATVTVEFYHANRHERAFSYVYHDCFPTQIETQNPSHQYNMSVTREVKMVFDYMTIINYNHLRKYDYEHVNVFDRLSVTDDQFTSVTSNAFTNRATQLARNPDQVLTALW